MFATRANCLAADAGNELPTKHGPAPDVFVYARQDAELAASRASSEVFRRVRDIARKNDYTLSAPP